MKKFLLTLVFATAICFATLADTQFHLNRNASQSGKIIPHNTNKSIATRAENQFKLQFCDMLYSWTNLVELNKCDYRCYIYIPAEVASQIAGNKVTEITFSCASDFTNGKREGSVFVTESLEGDPTTSTDCEIIDSYKQYASGGTPFQTVALDEPYTIKEGKGFYFGYVVKSCRYSVSQGADLPVAYDGLEPNGFSGYVDVTDRNGKFLGTFDMANDGKTNLFLSALTVGDSEGFKDMFVLGNLYIGGGFTLPVLSTNHIDPLYLYVKNIGGNALSSFEYSLDVNGEKGDVQTMDIDVAPGSEDYIEVPSPKYKNGRNNVTLNVYSINGADAAMSASVSCFAFDEGQGYPRKFVVEEGTGTWCGYCPRGIVGMEYMAEEYPDTFIPIAVHSGDNMSAATYQPLVKMFFDGFPSCIINRDPMFADDPNIDFFEETYDQWSGQLSPATISLEVEPQEDASLNVTANTTFAFSEDNAAYALAFVLLEDGIVDSQENYYANNPGSLEWWGDQPSKVKWTYEHTAVDIFDCWGLPGSVPATLVGGEVNSFSANISAKRVSDLSNSSVVALLLDGRTGTIINATKVDAKDYGTGTGIDNISSQYNSPIQYFDLNGTRLNNPVNGKPMIIRRGSKVSKVMQ